MILESVSLGTIVESAVAEKIEASGGSWTHVRGIEPRRIMVAYKQKSGPSVPLAALGWRPVYVWAPVAYED
jgi:hypothetical protein